MEAALPEQTEKMIDVVHALKIRIQSEHIPHRPDGLMDDMSENASHWRVKLRREYEGEHRQITTYYSMGSALRGYPKTEDVLSSLCLDSSTGSYTFEDYCSSFGLSSDSRKVERTWRSCVKVREKLQHFLGKDFDRAMRAVD